MRRSVTLVAEDDPGWLAFWSAYPRHVAKIPARKAWIEVAPSPAQVAQMVVTLAWQTPLWARDDFRYVPYPATWLRAGRWEDEPPQVPSRVRAPVGEPWTCPHLEVHLSRWRCEQATALGRPEKDAKALREAPVVGAAALAVLRGGEE